MSRPRIRSLKPEAWQDERVGSLSRDARLLFVGLITMADDEGRLRAQPSMLIGSIFPWDDVTPRKLAEWLEEIEAQRLIVRYIDDGKPYVAFRNWKRHQRINRPSPSEYPPPPDRDVVTANAVTDSVNDHGTDTVNSPTPFTPSRARGSEGIGSGGDQPLAATPQRSRASGTSRSSAETVECPRCRVAPGEKCDGVRGKRESCHLERHHAVGEMTHVAVKSQPRGRPERSAAKPYAPDPEIVALRDEHFPDFEVVAVGSAAAALRFRQTPITPEAVRALLDGPAAA